MLVCMVWLQMSRPGLDVDRAVAERHLKGPPLGASLSPPPALAAAPPIRPEQPPLLLYSSALPDWGSSVDGAPPTKCVFWREAGAEAKEKRTFTKACVIGERHSGTNFVSSFLDSNFQFERAPNHLHPHVKLKGYPPAKVGQGCLEHKHMPQRAIDSTAINSMDSTVAILVVRNVADWLAGMCDLPFDASLPQHRPLELCAPAPWTADNMTYADRQADYDSLLHMRREKYLNWLSLGWPYLHVVSYDCLLFNQGESGLEWLRWLEEQFGFPPPALQQRGSRTFKLPAKYGLHGFGPYGRGILNVSHLEQLSAITTTFRAAQALAAQGVVDHGGRPKSLSAVETLFHLPAFNETYRQFESDVLGYGGFVRAASTLPFPPSSPPSPPPSPPNPPAPPPPRLLLTESQLRARMDMVRVAGMQQVDGGPSNHNQQLGQGCVDVLRFCAEWARSGQCFQNAMFVQQNCKFSCNKC